MGGVWPIVRLAWRPRGLAVVALRTPTWVALVAGVVGAGIGGGAVLWALMAPAAEPYQTLADALSPGALLAAIMMASCIAWVAGLVICAILVATAKTPRDVAVLRCLLLSPIVMALPLLLWSPLLAIVGLSAGGVDFIAGRPAILDWIPIHVAGSPLWLVGFLAAYLSLLWDASCRLDALYSRTSLTCPVCLYNLAGLEPDAPCPECGRVRE